MLKKKRDDKKSSDHEIMVDTLVLYMAQNAVKGVFSYTVGQLKRSCGLTASAIKRNIQLFASGFSTAIKLTDKITIAIPTLKYELSPLNKFQVKLVPNMKHILMTYEILRPMIRAYTMAYKDGRSSDRKKERQKNLFKQELLRTVRSFYRLVEQIILDRSNKGLPVTTNFKNELRFLAINHYKVFINFMVSKKGHNPGEFWTGFPMSEKQTTQATIARKSKSEEDEDG